MVFKRKDFIDHKLYGLKGSLSISNSDNKTKEKDIVKDIKGDHIKEGLIGTTSKEEQKGNSNEVDRITLNALKERKREFLRTRKECIIHMEKLSETLKRVLDRMEADIEEIKRLYKQLNDDIIDIKSIMVDNWVGDYTFQLGQAMKRLDNARIRYILIEQHIGNIDRETTNLKSKGKINKEEISIIPELTSLTFFQLFKIGLYFYIPLILSILLAAAIITVGFYFIMGSI